MSAYSFNEHEADDSTPAMVPLADTLNHRTGFNNARLYYERDSLVMIAFKDCPAGGQLFNTYGDLGNRDLLLRYGFVDDPNPFHAVTVDLEWLADLISKKYALTCSSTCKSTCSSACISNCKSTCSSGSDSTSLIMTQSEDSTLEIKALSEDHRSELFDRFEPTLGCEIPPDNLDALANWCYLLSLPLNAAKKAVKPLKGDRIAAFLHGNKHLIRTILQERLQLYAATTLEEHQPPVESLPFGPEKYVSIIKAQDRRILQQHIDSLE